MNAILSLSRNRKVVLACAVFLASTLLVPLVARFSAYFSGETWCLFDDGTIAYTAWRAMLGELPHVSFPYYYSGGFELLLGQVFRVAGPSFVTAQWFIGIAMAVTAVIVFLMCVRLGLDDVVSCIIPPATVIIAYVLNFHLAPSWLAQLFVMLGFLIASGGVRNDRATGIFLAGICFGIASAFKQTGGIYAVLATVVFLVIPGALTPPRDPDGMHSRPDRALGVRTAFVFMQPLFVLALLCYVIRSEPTVVNIVMFLAVPCIMVALSLRETARSLRRAGSSRSAMVRLNQRSLLSLAAGYLAGLLPLVCLYLLRGGLRQFLAESFLNVQEVVARRATTFNFLSAESLGDLLVMLRRLEVFLLPPLVAVIGFVYALRRLRSAGEERSMKFLLLNCAGAAMMYATLFPNPNRVHVLFLLPMVVVPIAYAVDRFVQRWVPRPSLRPIIVMVVLLAVPGFYAGARFISGSMGEMVSGGSVKLRVERGGTYVPVAVDAQVGPVVLFLQGRPDTETFIGYDPYNKAIAFLAGRRIEVDYLQRHQFGEVGDSDLRNIIAMCKERKIDTVVLAKGSLRDTPAERDLFAYLDTEFVRELDTPTDLVFQHRPAN